MDNLEKEFSKASIENAFERGEAIKSINRKLSQDQVDILKNEIKQLDQAGRDAVARFEEEISAARLAASGKRGNQRDVASRELDRAESRGILAIEIDSLNRQLPIYKQLLDAKLITDEEYFKIAKALNEKTLALGEQAAETIKNTAANIKSVGQLLQQGLRNLFNVEEGSVLDSAIGQAITQSYDLARNAMNSYYDAELQRIQQSKAANIQRLDLEKQQLLSRAQSREEEIAIEQQFQAKKEEEERKAGERIKKVKKAEAKVALASELANIAVAAAQNPLNGITLGAAGIAMYALLSGLALGRYALRVNEINRAQFEQGGQVPTDTGGKITGPSHAAGGVPFNYEAEGGELAIIRTKNAPQGRRYSITGTHTEIASALNKLGGGRDFYTGAKVSRFEYGGRLGENLQPPVFAPFTSTATQGQSNEKIDKFMEVLGKQSEAIIAISNRVNNLKVYQVTSEMSGALKSHQTMNEVGKI
jgi:hypothetical protein